MFIEETQGRSGVSAAVARLVTLWALLGGALLLVIVLINVASVLGAVVHKPFSGDFELTEMGVAVAVFAFLPYCQLTDANVTADIFTANAPRPMLAVLRALASLVAFGFACILVWRMYLGMLDQKAYNYTTTILQVPIWWAFVPILVSLVLLVAAAALTFRDSLTEVRK
ncbi:TRAP transporter small permease [Salipiger sp. H15]|uniref:TRAP transporter small permease protein n=1 Tax=Alloyangia sp. H15 TaxID=3029062 RepID=A0AAU8AF08_9RHOB